MHKNCDEMEWFDRCIKPLLGSDFELKFIDVKDSDLGDLLGVQFDSDKKGGYIYFWNSGVVGFQLVDYEHDVEIVEDTTEEVGSRSYDEVFKNMIFNLK